MNGLLRWVTFTIVFVIQAGSFLEHAWLTWIAGAFFCLFLTVPQNHLANGGRIKYGTLYVSGLLVFLLASYFDMKRLA